MAYDAPCSDDFARTGQVVRYCRWRVERYAIWQETDHPRNRWGEYAEKNTPNQVGEFGGTPSRPKPAGFFSLNIAERTTFDDVEVMLRSGRYARFLAMSREIYDKLLLRHETFSVLGDLSKNPEASVLIMYRNSPESERVRVAMAWKGLLANQKAVLAFQQQAGGQHGLWISFIVRTALETRDFSSRRTNTGVATEVTLNVVGFTPWHRRQAAASLSAFSIFFE